MRAATYPIKKDPPSLDIVDINIPVPGEGEALVKLLYTGVNPIDYWIAGGRYPINPPNRIVGSEGVGIVVDVGDDVKGLRPGDKVAIYPWIYCGECGYCRAGMENLCDEGGIVGGVIDGCYAEYIRLPIKNLVKIGGGELVNYAVSGVSILTAYHAIRRIPIEEVDKALVYGASGNVGMFIIQYLSRMGIEVAGVSRKNWILEYGADHRVEIEDLEEFISRWGRPDLVVNPLGGDVFRESTYLVRKRGYIVTFGGLLSMKLPLDVAPIYRREIHVIGSTGGTYNEFKNVVKHISKGYLRARVWKVFELDEAEKAIRSLFSKERDGKILIRNNGLNQSTV